MHVIREPDGERFTVLWRGRHVFTGPRGQAWAFGHDLEYGLRCPHCTVMLDSRNGIHPAPACKQWLDEFVIGEVDER